MLQSLTLRLGSFRMRGEARGDRERGVNERERDLPILVALLRERHRDQ